MVEKEVEGLFMPWLSTQVDQAMDKFQVARKVVDGELILLFIPLMVYILCMHNLPITCVSFFLFKVSL